VNFLGHVGVTDRRDRWGVSFEIGSAFPQGRMQHWVIGIVVPTRIEGGDRPAQPLQVP
jgi:hypothetical protein